MRSTRPSPTPRMRCTLPWKPSAPCGATCRLICDDPNAECIYVPRSQGVCAPGNGGQDSLSPTARGSTMWIHNGGAIFVFADGSAKWRGLGRTDVARGTDSRVDPFSRYTDAGVPYARWSDGCHAVLFWPDVERQ